MVNTAVHSDYVLSYFTVVRTCQNAPGWLGLVCMPAQLHCSSATQASKMLGAPSHHSVSGNHDLGSILLLYIDLLIKISCSVRHDAMQCLSCLCVQGHDLSHTHVCAHRLPILSELLWSRLHGQALLHACDNMFTRPMKQVCQPQST